MPIMKRKDNLLDSTGHQWFRQRCCGCYMLYEGRVVKLEQQNDNDTLLASRVDDGGVVQIHKKKIKGFGAFAYPKLGYRKIGNQILFISRVHNYMRGLRMKSLSKVYSPATELVMHEYPNQLVGRANERQYINAVFLPNYDSPQDLDKLIAGDVVGVVLNEDIMIEPSVAEDDDGYTVYFRKRPCGHLNNNKEFKWYSPQYKELVTPLLGNYGVHL